MKSFSIEYKDLERWNVAYFISLKWLWAKEYVKPLRDVIQRKTILADKEQKIPMLSIHFDGSMTERPLKKIKGHVFLAQGGDLVYSKIDIRNGAIGLIPDQYPLVGFTSEFPIYKVDEDIIDKRFLRLIFHRDFFKRYLNSLVSGTSGRKRINPEELEDIKIPIPPVSIQQKIVKYWKDTQENIRRIDEYILNEEEEIGKSIDRYLGIQRTTIHKNKTTPVVINFTELERWDLFFFKKDFSVIINQIKAQRCSPLKNCANFVTRGWKKEDFPDGKFRYIQIADVNKINGITGYTSVDVHNAPSRATQIVREGDLLISTTRPYLAAFAIVSKEFDYCVASSGFAVIEKTIDELYKDFLLLFLKSYAGLKQFEQRMTGGLYPAIVQGELENILIPLPDKEKQLEIVTHCKELQTQIQKKQQQKQKTIETSQLELEAILLGKKQI